MEEYDDAELTELLLLGCVAAEDASIELLLLLLLLVLFLLPFVVAAVEQELEILLLNDDGIVGMVLQLFDVVVPDEDDDGVDMVAEVLTESVVAEDEADEDAVEFAARSRPPVFCCCSLCSL